jgi:hypothetical protein
MSLGTVKVKLSLFAHEVEVRTDELLNLVSQGLLKAEDAEKALKGVSAAVSAPTPTTPAAPVEAAAVDPAK